MSYAKTIFKFIDKAEQDIKNGVITRSKVETIYKDGTGEDYNTVKKTYENLKLLKAKMEGQ